MQKFFFCFSLFLGFFFSWSYIFFTCSLLAHHYFIPFSLFIFWNFDRTQSKWISKDMLNLISEFNEKFVVQLYKTLYLSWVLDILLELIIALPTYAYWTLFQSRGIHFLKIGDQINLWTSSVIRFVIHIAIKNMSDLLFT